MKLVGLISGGKDSIFNLHQCVSAGHEIVALANVEPAEATEEIDSYMYQTVGFHTLSVLATALGLPIYRQKTKGKALCKNKNYVETPNDEVEDLYSLLKKVKKEVNFEGVAVGAIASDYQRTRVENVCRRLHLQCFAYLWRRNEEELLQEMIDSELDAVLIKVASMGLLPETHLGMHIKDIKPHLVYLNKKFGVSICGEGGEYETLTVNCPLFTRVISVTESEKVVLSNDAFAPVAYLNVKNVTLGSKAVNDAVIEFSNTSLSNSPSFNIKSPYDYIEDCVDEVSLNLFPQNSLKAITKDLPFPFSPEPEPSKLSIREYWKSYSYISPQHSKSLMARTQSTSKQALVVDKSIYNLNYSSGWCCIGNILGATIEEAFSSLERNLERLDYLLSDIVFVNLFVKNIKEFGEINSFYSEKMPKHLPPARVCVETNLPTEKKILMSVVAHKQISKSQKVVANSQLPRDVMHVESISHWAPATIGPYSQCVRVGNCYYLAGQIPLIPGSMEIMNKPIYHQCKLTLRHVQRVMEAMNDKFSYKNVLLGICYVTSDEIVQAINSLWSHITGNDETLVTGFVVTGLPNQAQLEWEIVAYDSNDFQYSEMEDVIDDYKVVIKRCFIKDPFASSIIVKVSNFKSKDSPSKTLTIVTDDGIVEVLRTCLSHLRGDAKNIGSPLNILKVFFKSGDVSTVSLLSKFAKSTEHKVVLTGVPVLACEDPEVFLVITGTCH